MSHHILTINPGSTSTKIGVYRDEELILEETLRHSSTEIGVYACIYDQLEFRREVVLDALRQKNYDIHSLDAVVGRGGLLKPVESGTYQVNDTMLQDLKVGVQGQHASNLGGIIAHEIAKPLNIPAYIVDPVSVDELDEVAKITGIPVIRRRSIFHALNQKAIGRKYAKDSNKEYCNLNLIVAHMGGGITVGAHKQGKVVEVNNGLDGEGPFSPERSGKLPVRDIMQMCFSGTYTLDKMNKLLTGQGGYVAYFQTNNTGEICKAAAEGDQKAQLIQNAMAYGIAQEIGKCATVFSGKVEAILLTGGIAYNESIINAIKERVSFIAPVFVYPGEDELLALTQGGLRVLNGEEAVKLYE
ncbi:MAG: butyrate kinase [Firmicutes bacterium HGW-Firmicutes-1]|jgi:butyrate kinase|nr:MAG: butyrate kinase [Firmicutes bacterium HGW-Firmicutes-1]